MPIRPSYKETVQYLYNLEKFGMKFGLERVKAILKSIGNPEDKLRIIHVGGTNGKGSTSAMIASILRKGGYTVGLYTSPHLVRFNERIRINEREITDKKVVELAEKIRERCQGARGSRGRVNTLKPTFFEFTTAMAFLYFAEEKVDFAVMEVGLGGRLDATNVGRPFVSIITNIAKEHEAILGKRIKDIACEKAGIVKKGGVLVSAEQGPAALKVLRDTCEENGAVFYRLNKDFFVDGIRICSNSLNGLNGLNRFCFKGRRWFYQGLKVNLLGRHQYRNAACAIAALEVLEEKGHLIPESAVREGIRDVHWPGRLEIISKRPLVVLDCAHNPAGAEVLREALLDLRFTIYDSRMENKKSKTENQKSKIILVLGIMSDKDIKGILSRLVPLAYKVILTRAKTDRAASLDVLYREAMPYVKGNVSGERLVMIENVRDACRSALSMSSAEDMICVSGSVFTAGEAREALRQLQIENCKMKNIKLKKAHGERSEARSETK